VEKELRECRRLLRRLREDVDYHEKAIARLRGHVTGGIRRDEDEEDEDLGDLLPSRRYRTAPANPQLDLEEEDQEEEDD
jgi:hypothetical protein